MYLLPILLFLGAGASISAQDTTPPTALCQDITVQLDATGQAQIAPSDINNGSTDDVTSASNLALSLDISHFDCTNGWEPIGGRGIPSVGSTDFQSLALAPNGTPYVAYIDRSDGGKVTVRRWDGSNWIALGGSGISAGRVVNRNLAIGIASDGTLYVAYADAPSYKVTVRKWNGSSWDYVGGVGVSAGSINFLSMAVDPDGHPYLAYQDRGNGTRTTVLKWNGSSWSPLGGAGISGGQAADQSMAIAPDGTPYVAYRDNPFGVKTTVLKWNGSSWSELGGRGISAGKASHQSLAIAPDGSPYVAYRDEHNSNKTTVLKWDGSSWGTLGGVGISADYAEYQSMAIASDGTPYVAYLDRETYPYITRVLSWNGSNWSELTRAGITKGQNYKQGLAIASDGTPYLAYRDDLNRSTKTTILKLNNFSTLTVTDAASNSSTCKARVRVDKQAPTAHCQDITVQLATSGFVFVSPEDVYNSSSDVCASLNLSINPSYFRCTNPGVNTITLTVSDENNNTASCTASAIVLTGTLSLNGDDTIRICQGQNYTDQGALYTDYCSRFDDPVVGNTSQVNINQAGTYTVTYDNTDPHGNPSNQISRTVIVDPADDPLAQQGCGNCGQIRSNTCQYDPAPDLDAYVMSNANYMAGATLNWFQDNNNAKGAPLFATPTVNTAQVSTNWYWVEQQLLGDCLGAAIRVRVRVKRLFTPEFNLPVLGCGGSAQLDLAAWVSDPKNKATAYTFYAIDPVNNPGATPVGTASATNGVVNFGQYVLVNVSNGNQTYWVQSTVPNGCGGIVSSILNAPAQTAVLDPISNQTFDSGDAVNIAFSGQNTTQITWIDLPVFGNPSIGILGILGQGNLAFTATNSTSSALVATIRVIPYNGNCAGPFQDFTITVNPIPGPRQSVGNSLQFTGSKLNAQDVLLSWKIRTDFDLLRFEVEKKNDEDAFVAISEVAWTGNGSYQFIDQRVMDANNQYRLKLVLADGRIVWSETAEVNMDYLDNSRFEVFPNPSASQFQVKALFPMEASYTWQLSDVMGKVLKAGEMKAHKMTIEIGNFSTGLYHLVMISPEGKSYIIKVVKQ